MTPLAILLILWNPWALLELLFGDMHGPDTREVE
jgi:hypothetical protein